MLYQEPLIKPVSNWTAPTSFPKIGQVFGFDCETKDPGLVEQGPSSLRGGGYPVGVSLADENGSYYFPFAHGGGGNMDKGFVLKWLKPILEDPTRLLIGANLLYEFEWMTFLGIEIKCKIWDVQTAESLLDEEANSVSLNNLCLKYLGKPKNEDGLKEAAKCYGFDPKNGLWQLPAMYVGAYAEADAGYPVAIYHKQKELIELEGLSSVLEMEHQLIPVIWKMRQRGVRVDLDRAEQVNKEWMLKEKDLYSKLRTMIQGVSLDSVWSNEQVEAGALKLKLEYPKTKRGSASFKDEWLTQQKHNYWHTVSEIRGVNKLNDTFIRQSILENAVNGRVHCQFHPMRRDEGGTRSGRLSCSNPNLQQVPNPEHSPDAWKVRAIFIPEQGASWGKLDYSQQEPRLAVHYGCVQKFRGAHEAALEYSSNATADFYQILVKLSGVTRSEAKRLYLGRCLSLGTLVLTRSGCVPIEKITVDDLLWDGLNWVHHDGIIFKGYERVITYQGLRATANHEVWTAEGRKTTFGRAASRLERIAVAGNGGKEISLPYSRFGPSAAAQWAHLFGISMREDRENQIYAARKCDEGIDQEFCGAGAQDDQSLSNAFRSILGHASTVSKSTISFLSELWGQGNPAQIYFAERLCGLHFAGIATPGLQRIGDRSDRQYGTLREGQFEASYPTGECEESEKVPVFDILNAGPNKRFTAANLLVSNSYGMGKGKLARSLGISVEEAVEVGLQMDNAVPFIKELYYDTMRAAANRGFIKTISGRRSHFNTWEPPRYVDGVFNIPLPKKEAELKWPDTPLKRAGTHKAMNRLIQGSAADMTKRAMINLHAEGILPMLQVHDEVDMSFMDIKECEKAKEIMESALKLHIPIYAELKTGPSWGECK